jgi:hypothetical protein
VVHWSRLRSPAPDQYWRCAGLYLSCDCDIFSLKWRRNGKEKADAPISHIPRDNALRIPLGRIRPRGGWPCNDKRGFSLISDVLSFSRLWYDDPNAVANAIGYVQHFSRSHDAAIRVYDDASNVIETHEHKGDLLRLLASSFNARFRSMMPTENF